MGLTHVTVKLRNLISSEPPYESLFLVDTGATHCLAPASALRAAGVKSEGRGTYELANGQAIEFEYGFARVDILGAETVCHVIFGPEEAEPILGVVALENLGITVDPRTQALKRLPAISLK